MNALWQQFHFLQPWWLVGLALLPLLGWLGLRRNSTAQAWAPLVDAALLPHLLRGRAANRRLPWWLFAAGWTLCVLALAGPTWDRVSQPLYANRAAQVVAISLSQHMLARDVAPSRLDRARFKAHDLLASNRDGLNALIGYAGEAFVVAPLTSDAHSLGDLLDALAPDTMPVDGNAAALAIQRGVTLIREAQAGGGSLVLFTDQVDAAAVAAARQARAAGVIVSVLGVGTPSGGPVPLPGGGFLRDAQGRLDLAGRQDAALAALAAAGGGRYVVLSADRSDITALQAQLRTGPTVTARGQVGAEWQDRGPWLLLPLLVLVALAFRRGWLLSLPLVLLPLWPVTAQATTWNDWWQRSDQQAAQALRRGQPQQAQRLAQDPAWRGAAAYRAGDYAAAVQALQESRGAEAAYNLGNALARQGDYSHALTAYDRAMQLDPANADAKANRQAVEDWLRQHKKPQQPKSQKPPQPDQQPGQDQQHQQGQSGSQGQSSSAAKPGTGKSGASSAPDEKPASAAASPPGKAGRDEPSKAAHGDDQDNASKDSPQAAAAAPKPLTPQQQAAQQARVEQAQRALRQQLDQALTGPAKNQPQSPAPTHQLGTLAPEATSKLPADLQHALQRVPDDPGALLRRKFELEYQQRHGGAPSGEEQP
jgi:Ca-activated chloride channel family protein